MHLSSVSHLADRVFVDDVHRLLRPRRSRTASSKGRWYAVCLRVGERRSLTILGDSEGVRAFTVDLDRQEVTVTGTIPYDEVVARIARTGRVIQSGAVVRK